MAKTNTDEVEKVEGKTPEMAENKQSKTPTSKNTPDETATEAGKNSGKAEGISQEKVNELIGKVRTEAKEVATKNFLKDLGVESTEELKASLAEYAEFKRGQMTELEKIQADLESLKEENVQLKETSTSSQTRAQKALIKAEVVKLAANKFADPEVVYKLVSDNDFEVDLEAGQVSGVAEALEALEEQHPWMISKPSKVSSTSATNPASPTKKLGKSDEDRKAEYFGRSGSDFWEGRGVQVLSDKE